MRRLVFLISIATLLFSQEGSNIDVIILKDGSTIKGTILEFLPGEYIKISTSGGSELQIIMSEIDSIQRASTESLKPPTLNNQNYRTHLNYRAKINFCKYGWATTAGVTLLGSAAMGDENFATTVIPVVGPFLTMSQIESDPDLYYLPGAKNMLIASGVLQASFFSCWIIYELMDMSIEPQHAFAIYPETETLGLKAVYRF